jgi:hypothetical protein
MGVNVMAALICFGFAQFRFVRRLPEPGTSVAGLAASGQWPFA